MQNFIIEDWFSTPIAFGYLPFPVDTNIVDHCLKYKKSTKGSKQPWHCDVFSTYENLEFVKNRIFDDIRNFMLEKANEFLSHIINLDNMQLIEYCGWVNISSKNNFQEVHIHEKNNISAVVYLKAEENNGDIVFLDKYYDSFPLPNIRNLKYNSRINYSPITGKYLIFKSNTPHFVNKNFQKTDRISLSLNYRIINN